MKNKNTYLFMVPSISSREGAGPLLLGTTGVLLADVPEG